jgi:periplasmic divalent cation tolerance protein
MAERSHCDPPGGLDPQATAEPGQAAAAQPVLALTTEADQARAEGLARLALEARLAACVALRPVQSLYHWQGAIESATEVQLLFKTSSHRLAALEQLMLQRHSYSCPQWLHWPAGASRGYDQWLDAELRPAELSPGAGPPAP